MSKAAKRTVVEEEYMQNHRNDELKQVAKDLGRSYEFVRKYVATLPKEEELHSKNNYTRTIEEASHMINKTVSGRKGVTVMTETASQKITARRKKGKILGPPNAIRKIHEDK